MPPTRVLSTREASGRCSSKIISDKALIDAAQSIGKPLEYGFQSENHFRKLVQRAPAVEFLGVMGNRLDAKDAFAFGIDLERQLTGVQLEDCQIIRGSLDRDFPLGRSPCALAIFWPALVSENGFDGLQIHWSAAAVDQGLKDLIHVPADFEDQVSTVFDLIVGILVAEPAALLFVEVGGEAHTSANPTLADLAQSPYSPVFGQVSAIFAKPAASEIVIKQFPSLVKTMPALRAWQTTYS